MISSTLTVCPRFDRWFSAALAGFILSALTGTAIAESVIFTINPAQSSIGWSGTDNTNLAFQAYPGAGLSAPVTGHFLVNFDPTTNVPSSLQFIGGNGYFQADSPYVTSPGIGGTGPAAPANLAAQTSNAAVSFAIRDLSWDFSSAPISGAGTYSATTTFFTVKNGADDFMSSGVGGSGRDSFVGSTDHMTAGNWTLTQSSPGSGDWTLGLSANYNYTYSLPNSNGSLTSTLSAVATAHFGSTNQAVVQPTDTQASALGGSTAPGGVSMSVDSAPGVQTTLVVQQLPSLSSATPAAVAQAEINHIFAASNLDTTAPLQLWDVNYSGPLNGGLAHLVFNYDPAPFAASGIDPTGMWHFDTTVNGGTWVFLPGIVDTVNHTISVDTASFSIYAAGNTATVTPEPSSLALIGSGLVALAALAWRRKRAA